MPIIRESLKQLLEWSPNRIQEYCADLIKPLQAFLASVNITLEEPDFFCNHIFCILLPAVIDLESLTKDLENNKVFLSKRGEYLRLSVNVYNDSQDIES